MTTTQYLVRRREGGREGGRGGREGGEGGREVEWEGGRESEREGARERGEGGSTIIIHKYILKQTKLSKIRRPALICCRLLT